LGHTGFVGRHVLRELTEAAWLDEVVGLAAPDVDLATEGSVDVLAAHLAAPDTTLVFLAGVKRQLGDSLESFEKNIAIATHVCRALVLQSVNRVVFVSSAAVYGEENHDVSIMESTLIRPTSFYGIAKHATECLLFQTLRRNPDASLAVLRPPLIYGPGDASSSYGPAGFAAAAARGEPVVLWGDGTERREFLYVGDAARLIARFATSGHPGTYNLASGNSHSYLDVVDSISSELGRPVATVSRPRTKPSVDHRFVNAALLTLVPDFRFTELSHGIRLTLAEHGENP